MNYKKLRLKELQEHCSLKNLPTNGRKADLIKRLENSDSGKNSQLELSTTIIESEASKSNLKPSCDTLYIQLKASNLSYYFNSGVIYPLELEENEIYKTENRKDDLLSLFPDYIILSKGIINSFHNDEILIEIITNKLNIKYLNKESLYYTCEPIPISRIKRIHFKTIVAQNSFIASIKAFPDSFIEDQLCTISPINLSIQKIVLDKVGLPRNADLSSWRAKLKKFDKIMGLFSFMKNTGVFFSEIDSSFQEYTPNFFGALSIINSNIKPLSNKDLGLYKYILFPYEIEASTIQRVLFRHIIDYIYKDLDFDLQLAQKIIQEAIISNIATEEEVRELKQILDYFKKSEQHQIAFKDLLLIDIIRNNYPILALLFLSKFSNKSRQHTDKQAVRNIFISHEAKFKKSVSEYLLSVLGLYYGYKTMIKQDTNLNLSDSAFAKMSEKLQTIKFKLTSNLDRVIIESIFHFCKMNRTISDEFTHLYVPKDKKQISFQLPNWGTHTYTDNSYTICNTEVTVIDRKNKSDSIVDSIDRFYSENISKKSLLAHYLVSNFGYSKKALQELLKTNISKVNVDELAQIIDLDQRQKNNR